MAGSSLVSKWWSAHHSNYTNGRGGHKVNGIVIHHAASTSLNSVGQVFSQPGRNGSAHYGVKGNEIHQYVGEENTAWHCGNFWGNQNTIGIELVNSTGAPNWTVDDATLETGIRLVADIARRHGLGKLYINPNEDCPKLSGHRDWYGASTYCPGDYLYSKLQYICERANAINFPPTPTPIPTPSVAQITYEKIEPKKIILMRNTYLWDFNFVKWVEAKDVKPYLAGELVDVVAIAHNKTMNANYYMTAYSYDDGKIRQTNGFNVVDCEDYVEPKPEVKPTPPVPQPTPKPEPKPEVKPESKPSVDYAKENNALLKKLIEMVTWVVDKLKNIFK